jgi:two-component system, NarL family, response regulator NreC
MDNERIRVVIADDHTVVRAGLKAVLRTAPDIAVIGEASDGREVLAIASREKPDVIIMDLGMPELDGIAATRAIVSAGLRSRILILTMHTEEECLVTVMEAGAAGFLVKAEAHRDLVEAIRVVAQGDCFVRPSAARILAKKLSSVDPVSTERRLFESLSPRERDVLRFVALGFTSAEVGERVYISTKMVDAHKHRIKTLLNLSHRSQYVQFALKLGLLTEMPAVPMAQSGS